MAVRHVVDPSSVLRTLSALTGVPAHLLDDTVPLDLEATARFFHERVPPDPTSYDLFGSLGSVEQFLSEAHPCSLLKLEAWLDENADVLQRELAGWVPAFSFGLNEPVAEVQETIRDAIDNTKRRIRDVLPVAEYAARETLADLERERAELARYPLIIACDEVGRGALAGPVAVGRSPHTRLTTSCPCSWAAVTSAVMPARTRATTSGSP